MIGHRLCYVEMVVYWEKVERGGGSNELKSFKKDQWKRTYEKSTIANNTK